MAINYDALAFPKGTPLRTRIKLAKRAWQRVDERESRKVRKRSQGQCEVRLVGVRCPKVACQVHHHLGGFGVRGRGESALAKNKTHACTGCHSLIGSKRLLHIQGNHYRVGVHDTIGGGCRARARD